MAEYVPHVSIATEDAVQRLMDQMAGRTVAVLTGAGLSTESGIPDYRGDGTRARARQPVQYADFIRSPEARRRYWARALVGWSKFDAKRPNAGHLALARLQAAGRVLPPITQNVDRLHQRAGSSEVIELHGALAEVVCLECGALHSRDDVQAQLLDRNPGFDAPSVPMAPDGDAELDREALEGFKLASCTRCGGDLKPNVVFFGEGVPKERVEASFRRVEGADALLVLGSSLAVFSGFRFVRRMKLLERPILIVNHGETRADPMATIKLDARLGDVLPRL